MINRDLSEEEVKLRIDIMFSLNYGLLGVITPNVRAVFVDWDRKHVMITAIFDGPVSEENCSDIDDAAAEVAAAMREPMIVDSRCLRVDAPTPYENFGELSYARKEALS